MGICNVGLSHLSVVGDFVCIAGDEDLPQKHHDMNVSPSIHMLLGRLHGGRPNKMLLRQMLAQYYSASGLLLEILGTIDEVYLVA